MTRVLLNRAEHLLIDRPCCLSNNLPNGVARKTKRELGKSKLFHSTIFSFHLPALFSIFILLEEFIYNVYIFFPLFPCFTLLKLLFLYRKIFKYHLVLCNKKCCKILQHFLFPIFNFKKVYFFKVSSLIILKAS